MATRHRMAIERLRESLDAVVRAERPPSDPRARPNPK